MKLTTCLRRPELNFSSKTPFFKFVTSKSYKLLIGFKKTKYSTTEA